MYSIMDRTGKLGFRIVCGVSALPSVKAGPTATVAAAGDLLDAAVAGEQQKKEFFKQKKVDEDIKRRAEEKKILLEKFIKTEMKEIPARNHLFLKTEVTQKLYEEVMGENPSEFKGKNKPVEMVSWYDAVYFCNKLSQMFGLTPAYSLNGETDVTKWNYTPHKGNLIISGKVEWNKDADGFRLPTSEEWEYAAKGGQNFTYSGSDNLNEVGWYKENSGSKTHEVATKKANGYGLYDMSGNVCELVWDARFTFDRYDRGGCWCNSDYGCEVSYRDDIYAFDARDQVDGFRVVCGVSVLPSVSK
ncbi:MAG: SUMF1/EgtB/PvdO family nonheme iron enzyme [Treponema sp.]|nr:SUMF1/EgtB/PvdO family nonheme iron enzyme [Treponema sp.]